MSFIVNIKTCWQWELQTEQHVKWIFVCSESLLNCSSCDIYKQYWFLEMFPIGSSAFSYMEHVRSQRGTGWRPIKAIEWGTSLLCHAHKTPLSVRLSCSPNKRPCPAVSHYGCQRKVSGNLTGKMRCLHQIINTLTDRRKSVLGESPSTTAIAKKAYTAETCLTRFSVALLPEKYSFSFIFLHSWVRKSWCQEYYKMNQELVRAASEKTFTCKIKNVHGIRMGT